MNELLTKDEVVESEISEQITLPEKSKRESLMIKRSEIKGLLWVIGSFAICPCHLPLTLGLLAAILGGTAFGVVVQQYWFVVGFLLTVAWAAGTRRGFRFLSSNTSCAVPKKKARQRNSA